MDLNITVLFKMNRSRVNYVLDGKRRYVKVETNVGKKAMVKVSKI